MFGTIVLRRRVQRGYNLVEIGIILAVVGLVIGASIVPLRGLWQGDVNYEQAQILRSHQDAILGYALTHSTVQREVVVTGDSGFSSRYTLPGGRPYLPCPDVDGDGYEDRNGITAPGVFTDASDYVIDATGNQLLSEGNCVFSRGILPWKTLGVEAADHWGNRYTYEVDDIFSNAVVGFNQDTVADSFDHRMTVSFSGSDWLYQKRNANLALTLISDGLPFEFTNKRRPIVICDGNSTDVCTAGVSVVLEAGNLAMADYEATRRAYAVNDVIEGAVYAIVSHGANGHGAVNHFSGNFTFNALLCNFPIRRESPSGTAVDIPARLINEAVNFPFPEQNTLPLEYSYCPPLFFGTVELRTGFFVNAPLVDAGSGKREYDDIIVWSMRQELLQALTAAHKLPAVAMPVLRSY